MRRDDRAFWTKLCLNAPREILGAACAASDGELVRDPALRDLLIACAREAAASVSREGHRPFVANLERAVIKACLDHPKHRSSALRALKSRRRTGLPESVGPILAAARRTGASAPLLTRLYHVMRRLERTP